jgi:hypothetical protein
MNEQELRALVREAITRQRAAPGAASVQPAVGAEMPFTLVRQHASHAVFAVPAGGDGEGSCLIEPAVQCNHCGYCKSYGH